MGKGTSIGRRLGKKKCANVLVFSQRCPAFQPKRHLPKKKRENDLNGFIYIGKLESVFKQYCAANKVDNGTSFCRGPVLTPRRSGFRVGSLLTMLGGLVWSWCFGALPTTIHFQWFDSFDYNLV